MPIQVVYKKIIAEKDPQIVAPDKKISVNSQIGKMRKMNLGSMPALAVEFSLMAEYAPKVGKIEVIGDLILFTDNLEETYTENENGEIDLSPLAKKDVHQAILNDPLMLSISMARELKLPSPHQMPRVAMPKPE